MSGQTIDSSAVLGVDAETDDWKALGHCMDVIGECWDDGVSSGFVRANWTLLDRHLVTIINQAKKARKLLGGREDALIFASAHIEKCKRCGEECRESSITSALDLILEELRELRRVQRDGVAGTDLLRDAND